MVLTITYYQLNQPKLTTDIIQDKQQPEYIAYNTKTTLFSFNGQKNYVISADKAKYFKSSKQAVFTSPTALVFNEENNQLKEQWQIIAKEGILLNQHTLNLTNGVEIHNLQPNSAIRSIFTDTLSINTETQDIQNNDIVRLVGNNFTTTGNGLKANLKTQIATLINQVETTYEKNKP